MAEIPEMDKLEIKLMAQYLFEIDPIRFGWTKKFQTEDYLKLKLHPSFVKPAELEEEDDIIAAVVAAHTRDVAKYVKGGENHD